MTDAPPYASSLTPQPHSLPPAKARRVASNLGRTSLDLPVRVRCNDETTKLTIVVV